MEHPMIIPVTTTFTIEGYKIVEYLGVVRGIVVRPPTYTGQGFLGGLTSTFGLSIDAYMKMCEQARQEAYGLLVDHALIMHANAVVGMRYESSEMGRLLNRFTEVLCYGTAVVIKREE